LGGLPDVEKGWKWPERLEFLAQLNLEELAPYDINSVLPPRGLLRFFMLNLAYGWEEDGFRVEFYDGDLTELRKAEAPDFLTDLQTAPEDFNEDVIYREVALKATNGAQVGVLEYGWNDRNTFYEVSNLVSSYITRAFDIDRDQGEDHQVLGTVSRNALVPNPEEEETVVLLFSIDSCDHADMVFNDARTMYFFMNRADLIDRRFDRVDVTMT